ncbi:MAG: (2Fe-2S)-binding protein [Clostridium sp.]
MNIDMNKYIKVRMAQANGARTLDELKNLSDIVIESTEESAAIEEILKQACKCNNLTVNDVLNAINDGADTLEKVMEVTSAGITCGRCKGVLSNIIEIRR